MSADQNMLGPPPIKDKNEVLLDESKSRAFFVFLPEKKRASKRLKNK